MVPSAESEDDVNASSTNIMGDEVMGMGGLVRLRRGQTARPLSFSFFFLSVKTMTAKNLREIEAQSHLSQTLFFQRHI